MPQGGSGLQAEEEMCGFTDQAVLGMLTQLERQTTRGQKKDGLLDSGRLIILNMEGYR